jgi:hypothetical protein
MDINKEMEEFSAEEEDMGRSKEIQELIAEREQVRKNIQRFRPEKKRTAELRAKDEQV